MIQHDRDLYMIFNNVQIFCNYESLEGKLNEIYPHHALIKFFLIRHLILLLLCNDICYRSLKNNRILYPVMAFKYFFQYDCSYIYYYMIYALSKIVDAT